MKQVLIAGVSGSIGSALARQLLDTDAERTVLGLCRNPEALREQFPDNQLRLVQWDAETASVEELGNSLAEMLGPDGELETVIYAAGLLHDSQIFPEKRIEDLEAGAMARSFAVNCTGFGTVMRAAMPHLRHRRFKRIAAISAKVGSIGDNRFGGWYAYRCSKAALNMLVRNLSVELPRRCRPVSCVAVHPGTTESGLSEPFQQSLASLQVHKPGETAANLLRVIGTLDESSNGRFFSWDGSELPW
ncbi:SDR family oxidoreductase [Marinobacter pelagius]|uniref:NAD(P)-dependent dehydrogenase, short-chain alcohol dehydrogenase family n=1 Tax=Marinobacter pelagius TaxID=379482 RepID=A0A1I4QEQ4_9GAMM|nr:SDR family oxidoreductase [Marinobacter pelagius]SFM38602.1 NAD(P)-dependent dehydrogenase, short-chain alcohol dehydrogenase family [Marinobacter pelagius]